MTRSRLPKSSLWWALSAPLMLGGSALLADDVTPAAAAAAIAETVPKRPEGCYAIRNMTERVPLDMWRKLGVKRLDGGPLPDADVRAGLVNPL